MPLDFLWLNDSKEVAERLLLDTAGRIQLSRTQYEEAVRNYNALSEWVDEGDHELSGRVTDIYPSGSFAIGAAILGQVRKDQHDVDVVIELDLPLNSDPQFVMTSLYEAVRREPGSRYYDMTTLQSRCVTVTYKDGRTVDLMPAVRIKGHPERVIQIFHWNEETGESYHKEVNPKKFAKHFKDNLVYSKTFEKRFSDRMSVLAKAETQPMPNFEPMATKATRQVALQLIKRKRNLMWRSTARKSKFRQPPSVVKAALAIPQWKASDYLIDETIDLAKTICDAIDAAEKQASVLEVRNPTWHPDVFTDRWPESREAQQMFAADLRILTHDLCRLRDEDLTPAEKLRILKEHFGETPANYAFNAYGKAQESARSQGRTKVSPSGKVGILAASAASLPKRTNFGGDPV
nr:nucleotidyltransferase [uncultured Hyphomonas sp.]